MHPQLRKKPRAFSSAGSEHLPYKQRVGGSNPSTPTEGSYFSCRMLFGRLAQLVQSICLTSRGSAVRIRQRPRRIPPRCGIFCFYKLLFLYAGVLPKVYLRCFRKLLENFGFFSFVHWILLLEVLRCFLYTFELC